MPAFHAEKKIDAVEYAAWNRSVLQKIGLQVRVVFKKIELCASTFVIQLKLTTCIIYYNNKFNEKLSE